MLTTIEVDSSGLLELSQVVAGLEPLLAQAVEEQLLLVQSTWIRAVSGEMFPGMSKAIDDDQYAASIAAPSALEYPFHGDPFHGRVIATNTTLAARYERGYAAFDLKIGLLSGPAAKTGKDGTKYTTVPFVHSTPGSRGQKGAPMPTEIYQQAKALPFGGRLKLQGALQGYGLQSKVPSGVNLEARRRRLPGPMAHPYTWRTSPYEGMVRMGKPGHTTYRTFRRVSEHSDPSSWIHPGQPPNPVVAAVHAYLAPQIEAYLTQVIRQGLGL